MWAIETTALGWLQFPLAKAISKEVSDQPIFVLLATVFVMKISFELKQGEVINER